MVLGSLNNPPMGNEGLYPMKKIAVVVPAHNLRETTLGYLRQMREINADGVSLDLVIVDDGSTDGTAQAIHERYPDVVVLQGDGNLWWTGAVNKGVQYALEKGHDSVLIMNDDLELDKDFLRRLLSVANQNPNALVSSVTVNRTEGGGEEILTAGFKAAGFFSDILTLHAGEPYGENLEEIISCDLLTGASLLVPVSVFRNIGIFDDRNFPHNWGDFEFTRRASLNGYPCLVATRSKVYTEHNQNYPLWYFFNSTRREYLKNLFDSHKFIYGFRGILKTSYMHKPFLIGTLLYSRRLMGLTKSILLKLLLTKEGLQKYLLRRAEKTGAPMYLIRKLRLQQ